jgi:DNA polymerase epsilon subunit 2
MITTLLDQGHLCPLPLSSRPILWEYDNAMRVYPLPDVLVLADHMSHFSRTYMECQVRVYVCV